MISAALKDPRTVLHVLKYKASLHVLMAMFMSDCPPLASRRWLQERTGYGRNTMLDTLSYLKGLGVLIEPGRGQWRLATGARQLPLPLMLPSTSTAKGFLQITETVDNSLPANGSENPFGLEGKSNGLECKPPHMDGMYVVDDLDRGSTNMQHAAHGEGLESKPSEQFLRDIGMDDPIPERYGDCETAVVAAFWWYALIKNFRSPCGYVRRRLEGEAKPDKVLLRLAEAWLGLNDEELEAMRRSSWLGSGLRDFWLERGLDRTAVGMAMEVKRAGGFMFE